MVSFERFIFGRPDNRSWHCWTGFSRLVALKISTYPRKIEQVLGRESSPVNHNIPLVYRIDLTSQHRNYAYRQ